jgi:hypothetical protein
MKNNNEIIKNILYNGLNNMYLLAENRKQKRRPTTCSSSFLENHKGSGIFVKES